MINVLKISLITLVMLSSLTLTAQPSAPPATPIDGGLSVLLALGGMYGIKKLRDGRKQ